MSIAIVRSDIAADAQAPCLICRGKGSIALSLSTGAQVPCQLCAAPQIPDTTDTRRKLAADARNAIAELPDLVHDLQALDSIDTVLSAVSDADPFTNEAIAAAAQSWSPADPIVMDMRYANEAAASRRKAADATIGAARRAVRSALLAQMKRIMPALHACGTAVPHWFDLTTAEFDLLFMHLSTTAQDELRPYAKRWRDLDAMPQYLDCAPDCPGCGGQGCMIPPF